MSKWYLSCNELPLENFILALVDSRLNLLRKDGTWKFKETTSEIWGKIMLEYAEISGNETMKGAVRLGKDIGILNAKIFAARTAIYILSLKDNQSAIDVLRRIGLNYDYEGNIFEACIKATRKIKGLELELSSKSSEYSRLMQSKEVKNLDRDYFTRQLVEMGKYMGYRIDPKAVTVSEFVAIKKRMEREVTLHEMKK